MADMTETPRTIEDIIAERGSYMTNTLGSSMRPLFKTHRDAVILSRPDREIRKYDVVLYKTERGYILHRVIKIKGDTLIIRGDNTFVREYVKAADVFAYMIAFNRKGKRREITDTSYVLYSRFWNFIYPVRFVLRKIRTFLGKIKRKLLG
jgi:signal peptidase I